MFFNDGETIIKSYVKSKIGILIILGILFTFSHVITSNLSFISGNIDKDSDYSDDLTSDNDNLKTSEISMPIYINDDDPNYNWSVTKDAGICNGSGTYSDPYIIEDLIIDTGGSGTGIWIENSSVYFKIENCSVIEGDTGIGLLLVNNGSLINNNVSNCNYYGIMLGDSYNNTISGNIIDNCGLYIYGSLEEVSSHHVDTTNLVNGKPLYYYNNEINLGPSNFTNGGQVILTDCHDSVISNLNVSQASRGISLLYCNNNSISGNTANNNERGIYLYESNNNTISGNIANNNIHGIYLSGSSNNNTISGNTANYNIDRGISLSGISGSIIEGNTVNYSSRHGIRLASCNNITVSGNIMDNCGLYVYGSLEEVSSYHVDTTNLVNGKPIYYYNNENNLGSSNFTNGGQVILIDCHDSVISNLNLSQVTGGILLLYCNNNTISENTASHNSKQGIYLYSSNHTVISGNTASNNGNEGIYLDNSYNNTLSGNTAINNEDEAILLVFSDSNTISGNTASNTTGLGITVYGSSYNTISKNLLNYNWDYGIAVFWSNNNTISENIVKYSFVGIWVSWSNNNTISGNKVDNNWNGILLDSSSGCIIKGNTIKGNFLGIHIFSVNCNDNNITLNCFIDNINNAQDDGLNNHWDNGVKGNYWSDYTGTDADGDGIGDGAYNIDGSAGSQDNFPLMKCSTKKDEGIILVSVILTYFIIVGAIVGIALIVAFRSKRKIKQ